MEKIRVQPSERKGRVLCSYCSGIIFFGGGKFTAEPPGSKLKVCSGIGFWPITDQFYSILQDSD